MRQGKYGIYIILALFFTLVAPHTLSIGKLTLWPKSLCTPADANTNREWTISTDWRRGSVVRMSFFGWRTFPDLCL